MLVGKRITSLLSREMERLGFSDEAIYLAVPPADENLDAHGQPTPEAEGIKVECSFTDEPDRELWTDSVDIQQLSAEIRVKHLMPSKGGRFKVVTRFGVAIEDPHIWEILDLRDRGVFGVICALKKVAV